MQASWLSLLPPLIVLTIAGITNNLNLSLAIGVLSGALIATGFAPLPAGTLSLERVWQTVSQTDNLYLYAFLFIISILIVLLNTTGGARAFAHAITTRLKSARQAETSSLLISSALFIDDYLSCLTVGYTMRPITDRFHIPRAKLAYLIHALTGPFVVLAPVSSWVAAITSTLEQAGLQAHATSTTKILVDPFFAYISAIPYIFYSFFNLASVWFIVRARISFGSMHTHEQIAHTTGNLFGGKPPLKTHLEDESSTQGSISDFLLPLGMLLSIVILGSLWAGKYTLFGGPNGFFQALKSNDQIGFVLVLAGSLSLCCALLLALIKKQITLHKIPNLFWSGITLMQGAVIMVILASTLGMVLRLDLLTGQYLASLLEGVLTVALLPLFFFVLACMISMLTGSSWGTMMLLIPIAVPMVLTIAQITQVVDPSVVPILYPVLGAVFAGSVTGDHLSPLSATTVMAATSAGTYPLDHAKTQFLYGVPALIAACIAFLATGYLITYSSMASIVVPLIGGSILCCGLLYVSNKIGRK